jgi:hypothetical protein
MSNELRNRSVRFLLIGLCAAALSLAQGPGGGRGQAAPVPPSVEGDWVRIDPVGAGSWDALTKTFVPASLTPDGAALAQGGGRGGRGGGRGGPGGRGGATEDTTPHAVGVPYLVRQNSCSFNGGGQLGMEYDSEGFHMVVSKQEALVVQERNGARRIYLDGRAIPDASVRPPSGSGYSVGHFEVDGTLVIETGDMTPGSVTAGGYRTAETRAIQRYAPSPDGKHLTITFTWIDPKIYQKPHTYQYFFDRTEPGSYALETFCDATDPLWNQSIVPPVQK